MNDGGEVMDDDDWREFMEQPAQRVPHYISRRPRYIRQIGQRSVLGRFRIAILCWASQAWSTEWEGAMYTIIYTTIITLLVTLGVGAASWRSCTSSRKGSPA